MPTARSLIVLGTTSDITRLPPVFHAYGAPDDHHRLTVLLADRVEQVLGREDDDARACRDRRAVWSERMNALRRALEAGMRSSRDKYAFGIADIDALAMLDQGDWDERAIFKERRDFYRVLLRAIDRTGWVVFRPNPSEVVSEHLDELDIESQLTDVPPTRDGLPQETLDLLPPDCRPVAAWLHRTGSLSAERLDDIVEEVNDVGEHVLRLAYDALTRHAREAGKLLSAVRPPQQLNHSIGQFALGDGEPSASSLPRAGVEALRGSGFLQPNVDDSPAAVRMPRRVRALLENQARLSVPGEIAAVHARLARPALAIVTGELSLEVPFHALRSGDIEQAKATAVFSADLRDFGARLSREGKYADAAELFQYLVDTFDPKDAYAHEYLGYNLARAAGMTEKDRILLAYEAAHRHANEKNPLYHGRLLGFRGELGHDISSDFDRAMKVYASSNWSATAYFAEAVFKGLARGHRDELRARLSSQWGSILKRLAPRVLSL
jgi:hypothetical protein